MAAARTPFQDTSVPVERSQNQIRKFLKDAGALGVQFDEEWGAEPTCRVRFIWPMGEGAKQVIRLDVKPLPPERHIDVHQRERQAWRGLAHYLEGTIKAAVFGLIRFEDIFLSFMEAPDGRTLGDVLIPQLAEGRLALLPGQPPGRIM
jgi:hypothetical protein